MAHELLVRYGAREDVRRNMRANASTEVWTGPESLHYMDKRRALEALKPGEPSQNVLMWIDESIEVLDKRIEQAIIREERELF